MKKGGIHAFVELHIEQGPVLEKAREELGLVTAIAAVRESTCCICVPHQPTDRRALKLRGNYCLGHCVLM